MMAPIIIPPDYDYVGVYLTDACHLACPYCITRHHGAHYGKERRTLLAPDAWITGLNRLVLPPGVPLTLQGGEPFLYQGIWTLLENVHHSMDILTALPPLVKREHFKRLQTLEWNKRSAPYPTIRVSYHRAQHDFKELVDRVAALNDLVSIGIYYLAHPGYTPAELTDMQRYAHERGVELRSKEFLGEWHGVRYGTLRYPDAACGVAADIIVECRNTVLPIGPDGTLYRCHSDLYFNRTTRAWGSLGDEHLAVDGAPAPCHAYGLCSECDVKVKTNHHQVFGYTSVDIRFPQQVAGMPDATYNQ